MSGRVLVETRDLSVSRGRQRVLSDIGIELREGEVTALLGPNGAGKSTLVAALGGLLKPSAGTIERHGSVASALQPSALARRSALSNVESALGWWGVPRSERRARAMAALEGVHASELAPRRATRLSGGEQRRVHLARAIALDPDILLLDEPFAGLDPTGRSALVEDAASVLRGRRGTTLVVAHDRSEAWAIASRILVLMDGSIVADGPCQELLEHPPTAEVARFLGYDGEVSRNGSTLLTRPANVIIDAAGEAAVVSRVIPVEDGFRVALDIAGGAVWAVVSGPAPTVGATIGIRLIGGARF